MSKKFPWIKVGEKIKGSELPLEPPVWLGDHSNGEYYHVQTPNERRMRKEILRRADEKSRYLGMDRREFLASAMGMATTLTVFNEMGCSGDSTDTNSTGGLADPDRYAGKPFLIPEEADCSDLGVLDGNEFIFDVQTHQFDDGPWRETSDVYVYYIDLTTSCTDRPTNLDCLDRNKYGELMFTESDTTMAMITSWPATTCAEERTILGSDQLSCGLPLSNEAMRDLRDWMNDKAMSQRVVNQFQVLPNDMIERQIQGMVAAVQDPAWQVVSWKCYPAWRSDTYPGPDGEARAYYLTDPVGRAFIEAGIALGVPNFAIHKGLPMPGFDVKYNRPIDIGPIAKDYPEANFVIYHSGIGSGTGDQFISALSGVASTEDNPFLPEADADQLVGVNQLIRSLLDNCIIADPDVPGASSNADVPDKPNVYAEMGAAWGQVMGNPNRAQHYIGKLLKYLGPDNIVWGTDAILSGSSPQGMIEAFRTFEITPQYQEQYGYPALTKEMKAKIFGLNAAKLFRVDPEAERCKVDASMFQAMRRELDSELGPRRWAGRRSMGPRTLREYFNLARYNRAKGTPG